MQDETKPGRRVFFKGAATLAGAALVGAVIPIREARAQKMSKKDIQYQDTPKGDEDCDDCVYWKPPNACGIVEGVISPHGWCAAYNRKK